MCLLHLLLSLSLFVSFFLFSVHLSIYLYLSIYSSSSVGGVELFPQPSEVLPWFALHNRTGFMLEGFSLKYCPSELKYQVCVCVCALCEAIRGNVYSYIHLCRCVIIVCTQTCEKKNIYKCIILPILVINII
jgi:hypothetical protein